MTAQETAKIVERCKKGDQAAYSRLVDLYSKKLYGYFYRLTSNVEISNDLLSELFLKVVKNIRKFKDGSFESWIYRIATNVFYDYLRKKQRDNKLTENYTQYLVEENSGEKKNADPFFDKLQHCLNQIESDEKQIVLLRYYSEMSFKEIAELREEPIGTTLSKMHRTLKKLRELMDLSYEE